MAEYIEEEYADTLEVSDDPKSSARVLSAIKKAERSLAAWQTLCDRIDNIYSRDSYVDSDWRDPDYDLFWASMEIMKPAIYAKPPVPVVSPQFKDRRQLQNVTAELLERTAISSFERGGMDEAMCCTRDDLIFYNRGQIWLTYETDEKGGGKRVCTEHLDRKDFLHPPARKWSEVPWVARRAWMTREEMKTRFQKKSQDAYKNATLAAPVALTEIDGATDHSCKAGVWEVWHKADNRVYWVSEGVSVMLDEGEPHLHLRGFFPCPRPAYGTLRPRTLVPVPDYTRYAGHFKKINSLTKRIYDLLDMVRMKGLIPSGGEIGDAVEQVVRDDQDTSLLIPVPGAALLASGGAASFVQWLPLDQIAAAITGLIQARAELFSDFDRLSGISDIMRGETEAEETLGAQQLKSQYGSVRVREKIDELQRVARDVTCIAAEIMADNFDSATLLEMSQMEIPTKADLKKKINEIETDARQEMTDLGKKAKGMAQQPQQSGQQIDPAQAQQQLQQAQQQIISKYAPQLKQLSEQVPLEDVMKLLRDDKARGFAFEIATDSTVLTDEIQEKAQRNEFLTVFTGATQGLMQLASMGEPGAKLAGEVLKFVLQPYRVGRELNSVIDEFIDAAPQMAAAASQGGDQEAQQAIADANQKLAQAELQKAQASMLKVQADAEKNAAEHQRKIGELQAKVQKDGQDYQAKIADAQSRAADAQSKYDLVTAQVDKLRAETAAILNSIGLDERAQQVDEYKAATDVQMRQTEQAQAAIGQQHGMAMDASKAGLADRQQQHTERQSASADQRANRAEDRADRQQAFAERQPPK